MTTAKMTNKETMIKEDDEKKDWRMNKMTKR